MSIWYIFTWISNRWVFFSLIWYIWYTIFIRYIFLWITHRRISHKCVIWTLSSLCLHVLLWKVYWLGQNFLLNWLISVFINVKIKVVEKFIGYLLLWIFLTLNQFFQKFRFSIFKVLLKKLIIIYTSSKLKDRISGIMGGGFIFLIKSILFNLFSQGW